MASAFPGALDNYPTDRTTATPTRLVGQDVDEAFSAINKIQAELLPLPRLNTQTASYTLVLSDANKVVEINSASATTLTIPPNSSVAFPIGTMIEVSRMGAGTLTITAGSGVTIRTPGGLLAVSPQYGSVGLRKRATDEWVLAGALA